MRGGTINGCLLELKLHTYLRRGLFTDYYEYDFDCGLRQVL
jgi:hypothetical protein